VDDHRHAGSARLYGALVGFQVTDDLGQGIVNFFAASIADFIDRPSADAEAIRTNDDDCEALAACIADPAQREYVSAHLTLALRQLVDAIRENDPQALEQAQWWAREQLETMKAQAH
jgi:hypothetical protein